MSISLSPDGISRQPSLLYHSVYLSLLRTIEYVGFHHVYSDCYIRTGAFLHIPFLCAPKWHNIL